MMKRFLLAAACLLLSTALPAQFRTGSSAYDDLYDSETVHAFKEHVSYLSSAALEGRKAGSEGEKEAAEYVGRALEKYGIDLISPVTGQEFGIAREGADTLTSRNVVAFIPGWDKSMNDRYIVIGARLDNLGMDTFTKDGEPVRRIFYGANGNASGLAMLLELASRLSTNRVLLRRNILFVAFGASQETLAGSWYFLNRSFSDVAHIDAMINLDMLGTAEHGFYAYSSSNEDLDRIVRALQGELLPVQPQITVDEPYSSDHRAFYDKEIPSILFTTGRYPEHDTGRDAYDIIDFDGMEKELEYIYNYTMSLCNGPRPHQGSGPGGRRHFLERLRRQAGVPDFQRPFLLPGEVGLPISEVSQVCRRKRHPGTRARGFCHRRGWEREGCQGLPQHPYGPRRGGGPRHLGLAQVAARPAPRQESEGRPDHPGGFPPGEELQGQPRHQRKENQIDTYGIQFH